MEFEYIARKIIISALPILIAIIIHEISHGFIADKLGDPTAKMMGRLTLNPIAHIDIFGTIIMPLLLLALTDGRFVFGYAKPVPINANNFRNPKRDMAISAAAGPASNIILAITSVLLLKYAAVPAAAIMSEETAVTIMKPLMLMLQSSIIINIVLATFNMIPIPPLDGGRVLMGLLPYRQAVALGRMEPYGMAIIMILMLTGIASRIIMPVISVIFSLIGLI